MSKKQIIIIIMLVVLLPALPAMCTVCFSVFCSYRHTARLRNTSTVPVCQHIDKSPAIVMDQPAFSSQQHIPPAESPLHFITTIISPPIPAALK